MKGCRPADSHTTQTNLGHRMSNIIRPCLSLCPKFNIPFLDGRDNRASTDSSILLRDTYSRNGLDIDYFDAKPGRNYIWNKTLIVHYLNCDSFQIWLCLKPQYLLCKIAYILAISSDPSLSLGRKTSVDLKQRNHSHFTVASQCHLSF